MNEEPARGKGPHWQGVRDGDVLCAVSGDIGVVQLNRPSALHALTLDMVRTIESQLRGWRDDPSVKAAVLCSTPHPTRGPLFSSGADIRFFYAAARSGDHRLGLFFDTEFALDHLIWTYPKPVVALADGITMGGGMGLVQGAGVRVVTEHTVMAMPETGIGFFPDVGAGHFLARCPGRVGEYLALTGVGIRAADALAFGLADIHIPSSDLPALMESLCDQPMAHGAQVLATVRARATAPGVAAEVESHRRVIDRCFAAANVAAIFDALQADGSAWAIQTAQLLRTRSPRMLAVALEQIRRGRTMTLADDLRMERGMVFRCLESLDGHGDAIEGIRALVIDRDNSPRWNPPHGAPIAPAWLETVFKPPWTPELHPLRSLG